jgi:hypothetical protein
MRRKIQLLFANFVLISVVFTLVMQPLHELEHHSHHRNLQEHHEKQTSSNSASISDKCSICEFQFVKADAHQSFFTYSELSICNCIESLLISNVNCKNNNQTIQLRAPPVC